MTISDAFPFNFLASGNSSAANSNQSISLVVPYTFVKRNPRLVRFSWLWFQINILLNALGAEKSNFTQALYEGNPFAGTMAAGFSVVCHIVTALPLLSCRSLWIPEPSVKW